MWRAAIAAMVLIGLVVSGCGDERPRAAGDKLRVVTTIGMIADIVARIGGERVTVTGLMGPGVDPHLYKASARDVERLSEADMIIYNGLHLEGAMTEVLEKLTRRVKTVAVTDGIDRSRLLAPPEFAGAYDPHVWFDVSLWMEGMEYVTQELIRVDTAGRGYYEARSAELMGELMELHAYVQAEAERIPREQRVLITAHDAFNYFGRAYGLEVRGLQGISTAAEAGTADVQALVAFIVERRIPAIFVESSVPPRTIEAVRAAVRSRGFEVEIGGELFSDAMGSAGTPEGTYAGMVRHNIDTIVRALRQEQALAGDR